VYISVFFLLLFGVFVWRRPAQ